MKLKYRNSSGRWEHKEIECIRSITVAGNPNENGYCLLIETNKGRIKLTGVMRIYKDVETELIEAGVLDERLPRGECFEREVSKEKYENRIEDIRHKYEDLTVAESYAYLRGEYTPPNP